PLLHPERSSRCNSTQINRDNGVQITSKAYPDDPASRAVSINLSQYISKQITKREDDDASRYQKPKQQNQLYSDDISRDEAGDKDRCNSHKPERNFQTSKLLFVPQ